MTASSQAGDQGPPWLKQGTVIRDHFDEIRNPKTKMGVVVGYDFRSGAVKFVLINSRMSEMVRSRPEIRDRQVYIKHGSYNWLEHDSYIDCAEVVSRPLGKAAARIQRDQAQVWGVLTEQDLAKVIQEIANAATVKRKDKTTVSQPIRLGPVIEVR